MFIMIYRFDNTYYTIYITYKKIIKDLGIWPYPDADRERDRDLEGLLDPELCEGLLLREPLLDLPCTLPASLATINIVLCICCPVLEHLLFYYQDNYYLLNQTFYVPSRSTLYQFQKLYENATATKREKKPC